ncbi:hypothetical protein EVJ58_g3348 [Rhodofomes roseus]|uniref:D-lactate dehydrogenase (cytochrome) n=1 Tax=Rhodofomes roseus TaxID=34475 RepID=A0A4Y9YL81_9APHY|nr:hypothetical protein EVJ58_g3348 [Rhodofomes roseus]
MSTLLRTTSRRHWTGQRRAAPLDALVSGRPLASIGGKGGSWRYSSQSTGQSASSSARFTSNYFWVGACAFVGGAAANAVFQLVKNREQPPATGLNDKYGSPEDFQRAIQELRDTFPDQDAVSTDPDDLHVHGYSENDYHPGSSPSVVAFPKSTEDVVKVVKIANKYKMPVVPYSGATSLEGNYRAPKVGAICVDVSGMDTIIEIHEADSDVVCQPGVHWMVLNDTLKKKGIPLFFPSDIEAVANAVRYGTAKSEWFLNATVVLPNGEVIKTRQRSRKSSAGFDTTKLFIGAEGTLGIITEVTIRLAPLLPTSVAVVHFPDVRKATEAVCEVMNKGVGIQCVELCDDDFMRATNTYGMSLRKYPEKDSLYFKFQGPTQRSIKESMDIVRDITKKYGGFGFVTASNDKEAADLWMDRKNALYSGLALVPGARGWSTDVCVPVSRLPDLVYETKKDIQDSGIVSTIVGHVGDGNFHALLLFKNEEELGTCKELVHRMVERAIALDGTCTGEHGVGLGKRKYLVDELGEGTVELMKTIKRTIDPYNLFNPGKLYPDASRAKSMKQEPQPSVARSGSASA